MKIYEKQFRSEIRYLTYASFIEAVQMNCPFKLPGNRMLYSFKGKKLKEAVPCVFEDKGGIMAFSSEVNAMFDSNGFVSRVKGFFKNSELDEIFTSAPGGRSYSIGNFFIGRYFDGTTGKTYDEKSLSIEVTGIPSKLLVIVAEEIAKEFDQKEVLVKDNESNKIFFVSQTNHESIKALWIALNPDFKK